MLKLKNPTPRQISFFSAFIITSVVVLLLFILRATEVLDFEGLHLFVILGITFATAYSTILYFLTRYIYRKIKLIYKTIHKHKLSPEEKRDAVDVDTSIINEVEKEVEEWADFQANRIEELKSWQEYRRRFLGDISHELKTPIFNIQGYVETLLDGGLEDPTINRMYLARAAKNIDRLNTILDDLDAIARLESGEMMLELQAFDIKQLTNEVFEELEMKAHERNIELLFKPGAEFPYRVRADRESVRQVLINLVNNSIKYGIRGGHTKVAFYDMDSNILIEVADNGIGIDEDKLPHVFERFYRVDKSRSRAQGGSGLGLSIVKHIMEAHKQTVHVRSSINMGSTFGFTLEKA